MSRANPATTHDNAGIAARNFKLRAEIHSYKDAEAFLLAGENALTTMSRSLGPHMAVRRVSGDALTIAIVLYETEIIRYYPDGTFSVDNGGFSTPTTRERLQAVLPKGWLVYHHKKQLKLTKTNYYGGEDKIVIYPATHETRVRP